MKLFRAFVLAISLALPATYSVAQEFRLLSSWDKNYPYNPAILEPFMKGVTEASKGRMKFVVSGPETVPPFEQLQPVGSGVFQFLFTSGAYHFGTTPLLTAVEGMNADLAAIRKAGLIDYLDRHYQKYGLKIIALPITSWGAYHIILRQPIGASGNLEGRKVRGTPSHAPIIKMLGASMVTLPPSEIYTGLDKGIVDGAAWPMIGALDYRWYEVAKYVARPGYGINYEPIFMNLAAWNKLPETDRQILLRVARKVEDSWERESKALWEKEEKALIAKGMIVTEVGAAQKIKMQASLSEGLWELAASKNRKEVEDLRNFARSKGLIK
jgi:TRAP-type C4-dicarboxylate transport system substrate-binding protein